MNRLKYSLFFLLDMAGLTGKSQHLNPQRWLLGFQQGCGPDTGHHWRLLGSYPFGHDLRIEVWEGRGLPGEALTRHALWTEPDQLVSAAFEPNDPDFAKQWGLANTGQLSGIPGVDIGVMRAWDLTIGNRNVVAAIFDSGIDWRHPDLTPNVWQNLSEDADGDGRTIEFINGLWRLDPGDLDGIDADGNGYVDDLIGWDFVNNDNNPLDDHLYGHGTHVAGVIGARGE